MQAGGQSERRGIGPDLPWAPCRWIPHPELWAVKAPRGKVAADVTRAPEPAGAKGSPRRGGVNWAGPRTLLARRETPEPGGSREKAAHTQEMERLPGPVRGLVCPEKAPGFMWCPPADWEGQGLSRGLT